MSLQKPSVENNGELFSAFKEVLSQKEFEDLAELASIICQAQVAYISLYEGKSIVFHSGFGLKSSDLLKCKSFGDQMLSSPNEFLLIEDLQSDARFKTHPLVSCSNGFRFFLSAFP